VIIAAHGISVLAMLVFLLVPGVASLSPSTSTGPAPFDIASPLRIAGFNVSRTTVLWGAIGLDGIIAGLLFVVYLAAWRARYHLRFFQPMEYRALEALADVLVAGSIETVSPEGIAANVEKYIDGMTATKRRLAYRLVLFAMYLHPLLWLKPPLSELDHRAREEHLKTHFQKRRPSTKWWTRLSQVMIRVCQQLTYVGYYNDPRSFDSVGYVRFSNRPRYQDLPISDPLPHPLKVETPAEITSTILKSEICIVGTGAGGAVLAYNLARAGHDVLLLERGRYVEPRFFSEDEVEMIGKLYEDGVLQQTEDFHFTVLQGSCVGGSTVVNNAVCFSPPRDVLARWNDPGLYDAGLDLVELEASERVVRDWLPVISQDPNTPHATKKLNPSWPKYVHGAEQLGVTPDLQVGVVEANLRDCFGCGYCNVGCAYGKKLSMLDTALPRAQSEFPGRVRIISECEVRRLRALSGSPQRIIDLRARLRDGRDLTIRTDKYVVAAGAIGSSYLLLRSGIGRDLPVGKGLSFNMGAALTAEFPDKMDAYDGLQISHYGVPRQNGFVFETWWNPPVAQALNMPGWFETHFQNMLRYPCLMAVGLLVGTAGNGRVKRSHVIGSSISYVPEARDLAKLAEGLKLLGNILFAGGAKRVMLNAWGYETFDRPSHLARLDSIVMDPAYVTLGSGHPQGGNGMSQNARRGVVGSDFRVHGYSNLYVCDASVLPSSLTVNPQLTIMSLAHYAARRIG
jgi:choline dehydrogenase-like flavoprotein